VTPFTIVHKETGLSIDEYARQRKVIVLFHGEVDIRSYTEGETYHAFIGLSDWIGLIVESLNGWQVYELPSCDWEARYATPDVSQIMEATTPEDQTDELGPLPKEHPRQSACELARRELHDFFDQWSQSYALTSAEFLFLISEAQTGFAERLVRTERRATTPENSQ
jgi:hypothetical protein